MYFVGFESVFGFAFGKDAVPFNGQRLLLLLGFRAAKELQVSDKMLCFK